MLKVEGPDPGVVARRLRHHAEELRPLIDALVYALVFDSPIARDDEVHLLRQSRSGPGSFALITNPRSYLTRAEYHFRPGYGPDRLDHVEVRDAYQNGTIVATLRTPAEARTFARRLGKVPVAV